jgi:hypothetical protein
MKRRAVNGDEQDAYSQARHELCCLQRAGIVKKTKRRSHKRERQEGKREARSEY